MLKLNFELVYKEKLVEKKKKWVGETIQRNNQRKQSSSNKRRKVTRLNKNFPNTNRGFHQFLDEELL